MPKDWGTTGFVYRTDKVPEKPKTWREFVNLTLGKYSGKVTFLDGVQETIGSLAIMLGYSYNTNDKQQLDEVKKLMFKLKPHLLALTSTEYKQQLIAGKTVMAMGWNGDGAAVAAKVPAQYVVPREGAEYWIDAYECSHSSMPSDLRSTFHDSFPVAASSATTQAPPEWISCR